MNQKLTVIAIGQIIQFIIKVSHIFYLQFFIPFCNPLGENVFMTPL